jgi:hypothetical protein
MAVEGENKRQSKLERIAAYIDELFPTGLIIAASSCPRRLRQLRPTLACRH